MAPNDAEVDKISGLVLAIVGMSRVRQAGMMQHSAQIAPAAHLHHDVLEQHVES